MDATTRSLLDYGNSSLISFGLQDTLLQSILHIAARMSYLKVQVVSGGGRIHKLWEEHRCHSEGCKESFHSTVQNKIYFESSLSLVLSLSCFFCLCR